VDKSSPDRFAVNAPVCPAAVIFVPATVGPEVVAYTTPRSVISAVPSETTSPETLALAWVIFVIPPVETDGIVAPIATSTSIYSKSILSPSVTLNKRSL